MNLDDILFHLGESPVPTDIPASPAIYQTSNFLFKSVADMSRALKNEREIPFYTRGANPTVKILQEKIAALEGTETAMLFGSGSAAITAAVVSQVKQGDHIVCVMNPYSWTKRLIVAILARFGVTYDFVDAADTAAILAAVKAETTLIYLESPNSWTFEMQDLHAVAIFARERGIRTVMDNSFASPLNQQPANYGIDIMVHSATKYLAGHSDVVAGALCCSQEIAVPIFKNEYMTFGGILSPIDAWLLIRSLRTLEIRMERIGNTALEVATFLDNHPKVAKFYFPHAASFEQPDLAKAYLKGPSGLMTIDLNTRDVPAIERFCNSLKRFKLGCSWGSFESLAFPAITTMSSLNYDKPDIPLNRIRLSVGLESAQVLIDDLQQAFDAI